METAHHETDESTVPLNFNFGKTLILGGRSWKVGAEFNYFAEQLNVLGQDWFIGINITLVEQNPFASWFK